MTTTSRDVRAIARRLADDLLFPGAMRVEGLDALPVAQLDALAAEGLYGASVPVQAGGLGLDLGAACAITEERDGSRSVTVDQHPQRLAREALFLLVFGSRPGIKSALLRRFRAGQRDDPPATS
jgi:alkylation response protein AidB-like acyl-CoA dehydrogenase